MPSHPVLIQPSGLRFDADEDTPLLLAAQAGGIKLPSSCRNGTCRACMCLMLEGEIRYRIEWPGLSRDEGRGLDPALRGACRHGAGDPVLAGRAAGAARAPAPERALTGAALAACRRVARAGAGLLRRAARVEPARARCRYSCRCMADSRRVSRMVAYTSSDRKITPAR